MREEVSSKEKSVAVKGCFGLRVTSHAQIPPQGGDPFAARVGMMGTVAHIAIIVET